LSRNHAFPGELEKRDVQRKVEASIFFCKEEDEKITATAPEEVNSTTIPLKTFILLRFDVHLCRKAGSSNVYLFMKRAREGFFGFLLIEDAEWASKTLFCLHKWFGDSPDQQIEFYKIVVSHFGK